MREFERQIQKYKQQLPHMWEKVISAGVSLIVAAAMTVSSTFAWAVLSTKPEIKGINTTITANGNLEIALASGDETSGILLPAESQVGDGGKDLVQKNVTWGNLVNLGDPAYGLENLVLRPAALNTNNLLNKPFYGANYGSDGRVEVLVNNFAYAYWNQDQFSADKVKYGVRAVSSVTYGQAPGQDLALAAAVEQAEKDVTSAVSRLKLLAKNDALQDLVSLMGSYVQAQIDEKLGGSEPYISVSPDQIESICFLMNELKSTMELSAQALASIYNIEMLRRTEPSYLAANKFTGTELLTATQKAIQNKLNAKNAADEFVVQPVMLSELWTLRTDYQTVLSDIAVLETYRGRDDVKYRNLDTDGDGKVDDLYPAIETYVNHIADVSSTKINDTAIGSLSMSNISNLTGGGTKPILITKGIMKRMDKFTGAQIKSNDLTVTVKGLGMSSKATGSATTDAAAPFVLPTEQEHALGADTSYKGTNPIAGDTYGMALDFFLRTNISGAQLVLQGSPVYEEREETVSAVIDNETYTLYTVKLSGESFTAFLKEDVYYEYDREYSLAGEALGTTTDITEATVLTEKVKYIVGYNGVNRVWDESESAILDSDSTTQGAGSCYTFYAGSPEDQEKSLQLLKHFSIAFIDQNGTLLGKAHLDVEKKAEQYGKIVVPLVLDVDNDYVINETGDRVYTLMELQANTPTFVTALVYLDGENLSNDQVLAAGEIQGQLNIQFGTTVELDAMDDTALMESKCHVTATMNGETELPFDTATPAQLHKTITVTVDGYEPTRVEAYFLREINSTQGVRQQKMVFTKNAEGKWVASHDFTAPGKYILREVFLDGVAYDLDQDEPITFALEGFTISNLYCADNGRTFMTTARSFDTTVNLTFASDEEGKMPSSVKGAFIHTETGNRTTVYFTRTVGATWSGSASFTTSGEYRMEYLELDGEYTGLAESQFISLNLYLGLTASVYAGDTNFALGEDESRDVAMSLQIKSDSGEVIGNLNNVWLQYSNGSSDVQERGLGAEMRWNADRQMYEGTFHMTAANAGIYNYHYVSINLQGVTNTLNEAVVAPAITAISSNPPRYISKDGFGEVFSMGDSAHFTVRMKNANSATLDAELVNQNGDTYYVRGSIEQGAEQVFTFMIPLVNGSQKGTWTLQRLFMTNVYGGANNILYDGSIENGPDVEIEGKPLYTVADNYYFRWLEWTLDDITAEGEEDREPVLKVLDTLQLSVDAADVTTEYSSSFGKTHKFDSFGMSVKVVGGSSELLADYGLEIDSIRATYKYDTTCVGEAVNNVITNAYGGGYAIAKTQWDSLVKNSVQNPTVEFTKSGESNGAYTLATTNESVWLAGEYKLQSVELNIKAVGASSDTAKKYVISETVMQTLKLTAPVYTIRSAAPTVKITGVSTGNSSNTYTDTSATVYMVGNRVIFYTNYTASSVTINLSGIGTAASAKLMFADTARIYTAASSSSTESNTPKSSYTWTADGTCTRSIGHVYSKTLGDTKTAAGTITASQLELYKNDCTFRFDVSTITISNPS